MNAYELAEAIENWDTVAGVAVSFKAGAMLRQQADLLKTQGIALKAYAERITELEQDLHMVQRHYDQLEANK